MIKSNKKSQAHGNIWTYLAGFIMSVALTLTAYFIVVHEVMEGWTLIFFIVELGVIQLLVQLFLFLHLGDEPKPKWNVLTFLFMLLVVGILVGGSLWIMSNLDYHKKMTPEQQDQHIIEDEGYDY